MNPKIKIEDVQGQADARGLSITQVGISEVQMPLVVADRDNGRQQVTATIRLSASLSHAERGTHMSRFIEALERHKTRVLNTETLDVLLEDMVDSLNAERSFIDVRFTYFRSKASPVTGEKALMGYDCRFGGDCESNGAKRFRKLLEVDVPVLTLCPCSKTISDYGAHNQRTLVKAGIELTKMFWIEELIDLVEEEGSSAVYPLLKRLDEKHITEHSYRNPKFVEDLVRDVTLKLIKDERVVSYKVECESQESIHAHNAWANITSDNFPSHWR